jgi:hypothetical protein
MQLWKVPFKGGAAVQATTHIGVYATESDDGRSLYYFGLDSLGSHSILRKPLNGGEETRVLVSSSLDWFAWALTHEGIYFVDLFVLAVQPLRLRECFLTRPIVVRKYMDEITVRFCGSGIQSRAWQVYHFSPAYTYTPGFLDGVLRTEGILLHPGRNETWRGLYAA